MTAGREVPRVHGLLEKLLRVVLPELADRRVRMDDRVLQPAAHALHLADVDVLRGVAVRVHLHRATRRVGDLDLSEGAHEGRPVLDLAADRAHGLADDPRAGVAILRVEGRRAVVRLLEGRAEAPVGGRVEGGGVVVGAHHAERFVAELREDVLVAERSPGDEGQPVTEAALRVLLRRSEEHTSELQSQSNLVCRLLLEKKKKIDPAETTMGAPLTENATR